ncbi:indole-3-glycerol phosphate synthase TrpC [Dehalobacterium formicoaceticum]|uniref:Indole-3-glycerol phosphate synthase n=1 Tax=Dehalobacterium formicoaceticum TaxID=51515 RepID=A0ABT1Y7V0_9FIRM|nr:indole-3-glycerol phosphate synthase TrpC [Dehalobacterium formicoaceticum]MCR6546962.1 indole-3-glycerol phosphate synthase TrpC [Dehalobacterium formicoaceticum]
MMKNILSTIAEHARVRVAEKKKIIPLIKMKEAALSMDCRTGFPFEQALKGDDIGFICECKKASPSVGLIAPEFPYLEIAKEYEKAGAACISVLTEPKWFMGRDHHLKEIADSVSIPCLRKDFTIDEYMIYEAKILGASAVLLICSLLDREIIGSYLDICDSLGLSAVVEVHDEYEISESLEAGARIIGINNRNLRDFTVDVHNSERLRKLVPHNLLVIAESGIRSSADIDLLRRAKINSVLIGETLMRATDKKAMLDDLRGKGGQEVQEVQGVREVQNEKFKN